MASPILPGIRRQQAALGLAGALLVVGLLAALLITSGVPVARADGPVLTVSSGTTNAGKSVTISGTGWAPARHYDLYVYGQAKCKPDPICPPPSGTKKINDQPINITSDGNLSEFEFTFINSAAATTYVFTVIADYPADNPLSASVLVQVVPKGTPPSGTPVSSSPTAEAETPAPTEEASPTTTSEAGASPGTQTNNTSGGSGSNTLATIVVAILLAIAIVVLIGLLIVLPPKRRAIRAAWYDAGSAGGLRTTGARRYGASGPMTPPGARRTSSGGYPPVREPEMPWQGGVAQWGDQPRPPRGSRPMPPSYPPRRPPGREY